jgi:two-component system OmpR family response regulator
MTDKKEDPWCCSECGEIFQRVLIVDDEKQIRDILHYALVSYGLLVTTCENAPEALLRSLFDDFHFIITDYDMPGMNGIELVRRLRERHPLAVIIGMSGTDKGLEFLSAGANDFLQKPFIPYRLAMMIDGRDLQL